MYTEYIATVESVLVYGSTTYIWKLYEDAIYIYIYISTSIYVFMYLCATYRCVYANTQPHIQAYTHVYTQAYKCTHNYVYTTHNHYSSIHTISDNLFHL